MLDVRGSVADHIAAPQILENPAVVGLEQRDVLREVGLAPGDLRELLKGGAIDFRSQPDAEHGRAHVLQRGQHLIQCVYAARTGARVIFIAAIGYHYYRASRLDALEARQAGPHRVVQRRAAGRDVLIDRSETGLTL